MSSRKFTDALPESKEIWRDVVGYEGKYQVSSMGRVKSLSRARDCGHKQPVPERILKLCWAGTSAYLSVSLHKSGKSQMFRVHRLMAKVFLPNPEGKLEVNHKDADRRNNKLSNLEWATRIENAHHAMNLGLYPTGNRNGNGKLTDKQEEQIRERLAKGETGKTIAPDFGVSPTLINQINRGEVRKKNRTKGVINGSKAKRGSRNPSN